MFSKRFALSSLLVVFAFGAFLARPARAASLSVTTTADVVSGIDGVCSLREAIIAANTNTISGIVLGECPAGSDTETDVITLADGATYSLTIAGMDEEEAATGDLDILDNAAGLDLQLVVEAGGTATIDAEGLDRVLDILTASVEITGLTLTNGDVSLSAAPAGGVVLNRNGLLAVNGGIIRSGKAEAGGGLYNVSFDENGGRVMLNGTQVFLNEATNFGGGILSGGMDAYLSLLQANVRANITHGSGAGVALDGGVTEIISSTITLNVADESGGGIISDSALLTITHTLIEGNQALIGNGGGLNLTNASAVLGLSMSETTFSSNSAGNDGGALYEQTTEFLHLNGINFYLNTAGNAGGAVFAPYLNVMGGTYDQNEAAYGGAIFGGTSLIVNDADFTNNSALDGGALNAQFLEAGRVTLTDNHAEGYGGGAYVWNYHLQVHQSSWINNHAGIDGGGIYHLDGVLPATENFITESLFFANTASGNGGGYWTGDSMTIANTTLAENQATGFGGGVYIAATGLVTTTNTTMAVNQANGMQGSGLYNLGKVWLGNTLFGSHPFGACYTDSLVNLISLGHNLSEGNDCNLNAAGDQPNTPAGLVGAVQNNGGPTWTWALDSSSSAINAGDDFLCASLFVNNKDQRGFSRIQSCDIGAFELVQFNFLPLIIK